nr:hypothetical protein CFP56_77749 [Quercus suber]
MCMGFTSLLFITTIWIAYKANYNVVQVTVEGKGKARERDPLFWKKVEKIITDDTVPRIIGWKNQEVQEILSRTKTIL